MSSVAVVKNLENEEIIVEPVLVGFTYWGRIKIYQNQKLEIL
jgi:hypothetical protein